MFKNKSNALDLSILLNGSEIWTLKKKGIKMIDISGNEISPKNSRVHSFLPQKE
jgi:hypothetical protein